MKSIILAQEETRRLGHNHVGTEQILLGLMGEGTGIAAQALKSFSVSHREMRVVVENVIGRGYGHASVEIPLTEPAKRGLELSWTTAKEEGVNYIDTDHLLLGILRAEDEVLLKVLQGLSLDPEQLRRQTLEIRSKQKASPDSVQARQAKGRTEQREAKRRVACKNCGESVSTKALRCQFCRFGLSDEHFKSCQICGESIRKAAIKCMHCQSILST